MAEYDVHIFAVVRVKVSGVIAESQSDAISKAEQSVPLDGLLQASYDGLEIESTGETIEYLVDEVGDLQYENSRRYCADGTTLIYDESMQRYLCPVCRQPEAIGPDLYEIKLNDIREHPDRHQHTFWELQQCCMVKGALDLHLMEIHPRILAMDRPWNGRRCDVTGGPCACGGWH